MTEQIKIPGKDCSPDFGSPYFADLIEAPSPSAEQLMDQLLNALQTTKDSWVNLGIPDRIAILDEIRKDLYSVKDRWIQVEIEAKGISPGSMGEAEEWTILATIFRALRKHQGALIEIQERGKPRIPGTITVRADGQVVVPVFPHTLADRLLFLGTSSEVWMEPGLTVDETIALQSSSYRDEILPGKVALVLGGGNASLLPVCDLLHKLFVELQVVIVKLNPVNAHLGPLMEMGFRALIDRGYLAFAYGGAEVGDYLCHHPDVDELHLTGSDKTYEAIVFGLGSEGEQRKAQRAPRTTKRFTGELGNISPVIVVPGPWGKGDVETQANQIASWLVANAGFACLTPRVIIQHASWPQRDHLLEEIGRVLDQVPTRQAYYPGAHSRHAEFLAAHPEASLYGSPELGQLPWTIIPGVDPSTTNDICFKREAFCSLCAETAIESPDVVSFIDQAVDFANNTLWGSLCATLIVHPESMRDAVVARAVERAIARLRYGTVSVNMLAYYSGYFMTAPWGAYPGHDIYDIQSGIGKTFNSLMLERSQKSVTRAPFNRLDPVTIQSKRPLEFSKKLAEFEAAGSLWKLPNLMVIALRS